MNWSKLHQSAVSRLQQRLADWMNARQPAVPSARLVHRNIYILPTRQGLGFFVLIVLLWLMGTNYENNLVLALGFFLLAVMLMTIFLTHRNIDGLQLEIVGAASAFAGQPIEIELQIKECQGRARSSIELSFESAESVSVDIGKSATVNRKLHLETHQRGWFSPGRLRVQSVYPLGLFRSWSLPLLDSEIVVYPRPLEQAVQGGGGQGSIGKRDPAGIDELSGIDTWQEGSGLQRVAWKQFAAGRGMYEKRFEEGINDPLWLDWNDHRGGTELRLSALCDRAIGHARRGDLFGLRLPRERLDPSAGDLHFHRVLTRLALYQSA